jgi:four helix bundle protein
MDINNKQQIPNDKQIQITNNTNSKQKKYDLEERTFLFSQRIIGYIKKLPRSVSNQEISRQLIRSAGSIGANYIEANEALTKKDFVARLKISRKEAKETCYWIRLSEIGNEDLMEKETLILEVIALKKILSAILIKSTQF